MTPPDPTLPKVIDDCHELLKWLIPLLDKFPRSRRFTLSERLESGLLNAGVRSHNAQATFCLEPGVRRATAMHNHRCP